MTHRIGNNHVMTCYFYAQNDQATEQYYLRAKYDTPALRRFFAGGVCRRDGLNLYAYCGNNQEVYCDPSGYKKAKTPCEIDELGGSSEGTGKEELEMTMDIPGNKSTTISKTK